MSTRKHVAFIADSLDNAHRFQQAFARLGVEVSAGSTMQIDKLLDPAAPCDCAVFEARGRARAFEARVRALAQEAGAGLLLVIDDADFDALEPPFAEHCDYVAHGAGVGECVMRLRRLLWSDRAESPTGVIAVDTLSINLATYQVTVAGEPVDFTYLEYALLAFLASHPGRTFSRDALLQRVWGFEYYGGSRTVDVHVRRIRAKLGPEISQRLETVRGVGYLWSA
ncbi:transcriptional regulator [Berryella wangjianweii]|uniref:Transcriptional regulator n=1 Tax=Berryella wangjianweii TaxID=2734634 RepID=A0A6M8J4R2_9ACTN|nr:winged helix family transcriptional regulator [Berryella wangjianweii]QKF06698.1 transcriptional regulator [Berryella wangjianweii]